MKEHKLKKDEYEQRLMQGSKRYMAEIPEELVPNLHQIEALIGEKLVDHELKSVDEDPDQLTQLVQAL